VPDLKGITSSVRGVGMREDALAGRETGEKKKKEKRRVGWGSTAGVKRDGFSVRET